jgi:hypothetical protein
MQNKLKIELEQMMKKRQEMRDDLRLNKLSSGSTKAIRIELTSLDTDIINLRKEIDDMKFQDFMHRAWRGAE